MSPAAPARECPASFYQRLVVAGSDDGWENMNVASVLRFHGPFVPEIFQEVVSRLVDRHEVLRTTLSVGNGALVQKICSTVDYPFDTVDLRESRDTLTDRLLEFTDADVQLLGRALFAVRIFKLGQSEHVLAFRFHHAIADLWSANVFEREFRALYSACASGEASPLPPPAARFRDYVAVERSPAEASRVKYWTECLKRRLSSVSELVDAPSLSRCGWMWQAGPPLDTDAMAALTRNQAAMQVTEGILVLAGAASTFVGCEEERVLVAVNHSNRFHPKFAGVVGMIADILPVEIDLSGRPTYRQLVTRVRDAWILALRNRIGLYNLSKCSGRDFLGGESLVCDFQFNYLPGASSGSAPFASEKNESFDITPVPLPFIRRRVSASRHTMVASWGVFFSRNASGELQGTISAQAGTAEGDSLRELGSGVMEAMTRAVNHPDRRLQGSLAS